MPAVRRNRGARRHRRALGAVHRTVAVAAAGWTLSVLDGKGDLLPAGVERLLEIGQYSQVLLQRPGLQPR